MCFVFDLCYEFCKLRYRISEGQGTEDSKGESV